MSKNKKMDLKAELKVQYVPLPPGKVEAWKAGILLLLKVLKGDPQEEQQVENINNEMEN